MAHLTSSALGLLGLLISSSFLGARSARECARGWMKYERNCYSYFDNQVTWSTAEIGRWKWIDGAISSWKAWLPGEPSKGKSKFCAEICQCTGWKKRETSNCDKLNAYICKYEM